MRNISKNYTAQFYPMTPYHGEEAEPGDITYKDMVQWIFEENKGWEFKVQEYIEGFQCFDNIDNLLLKSTKKVFCRK